MDYTVELNEMINAIIDEGTLETTGCLILSLDELSDEYGVKYDTLISIKDELIEMLKDREEVSKVNFESEDDFNSASLFVYFHEEYCDFLSSDED